MSTGPASQWRWDDLVPRFGYLETADRDKSLRRDVRLGVENKNRWNKVQTLESKILIPTCLKSFLVYQSVYLGCTL